MRHTLCWLIAAITFLRTSRSPIQGQSSSTCGTERLLEAGRTIAQLILGEVTKRGFGGNVSIAANPDTAHYAARGFKGVTIIEPGYEAQRLGTLPVEVLGLESDVQEV